MEYGSDLESFCEYQNIIDDMELMKRYTSYGNVLERIMLSWDIHQMKRHLDDVYFNSLEYYSLEDSYQEVIYDIAMLFHNMEIVNPISIFGLYNYLFRKGYFSLEHCFVYKPFVY